MSDGFMLYLDDDGVARHYDDTYDITIHCESEEEQRRAVEIIKSKQWIPCSDCERRCDKWENSKTSQE